MPIEAVWAALIDAARWPDFYANARNVRVDGLLREGLTFRWTTLGVPVTTTITVCEPPHRLTWRGDTWYGRGCHTWIFEPTDAGCHLVTEEVQRGLVPTIAGFHLQRQLLHWHQRWLEGLVEAARLGG